MTMPRKYFSLSIGKPGEGQVNEDAAMATENRIAVSDGAGGGGLYADLWSAYLLKNLPVEPITDFGQFDAWLDGIWEAFYNDCEEKAGQEGGMTLTKFYSEGSFATLAAVWKLDGCCQWMAYGDSVAFHYNTRTKVLEYSFTRLSDFNNPPYLVNCKDPLQEEGFRHGVFRTDNDSIVFCATDALAHYILMTYEIAHCTLYGEELAEAANAGTKNSVCINSATAKPVDFGSRVINKLCKCSPYNRKFENYMKSVLAKRYVALDDYSFSLMMLAEM